MWIRFYDCLMCPPHFTASKSTFWRRSFKVRKPMNWMPTWSISLLRFFSELQYSVGSRKVTTRCLRRLEYIHINRLSLASPVGPDSVEGAQWDEMRVVYGWRWAKMFQRLSLLALLASALLPIPRNGVWTAAAIVSHGEFGEDGLPCYTVRVGRQRRHWASTAFHVFSGWLVESLPEYRAMKKRINIDRKLLIWRFLSHPESLRS